MKCFVCANVANPATVCGTGKCSRLFCKPCIDKHVSSDSNCPNTKFVHQYKDGELSEMFEEALQSMSFTCADCGLVYAYNDCFKHRKLCMLKAVSCVLNCGDTTLYKGVNEHLNHFKTNCLKIDLICGICKVSVSKTTMADHDCAVGLISQVASNEDGVTVKMILAEMNERIKKMDNSFKK